MRARLAAEPNGSGNVSFELIVSAFDGVGGTGG